jgi:hypothetical protein
MYRQLQGNLSNPGHLKRFTDMPVYRKKIEELKFGGDQLLLQGGHHPIWVSILWIHSGR